MWQVFTQPRDGWNQTTFQVTGHEQVTDHQCLSPVVKHRQIAADNGHVVRIATELACTGSVAELQVDDERVYDPAQEFQGLHRSVAGGFPDDRWQVVTGGHHAQDRR